MVGVHEVVERLGQGRRIVDERLKGVEGLATKLREAVAEAEEAARDLEAQVTQALLIAGGAM